MVGFKRVVVENDNVKAVNMLNELTWCMIATSGIIQAIKAIHGLIGQRLV